MEVFLASSLFALFVVLPGMRGMSILYSRVPVYPLHELPSSEPLHRPLYCCSWHPYLKFSDIWNALAFCVAIDSEVDLLMEEISPRAGIKMFVVALLATAGVKTALYMSGFLRHGGAYSRGERQYSFV